MKSAIATLLPYLDSPDAPMETESSDETVELELYSTMEVQLPLPITMPGVSEDMTSTVRPGALEEEAYAWKSVWHRLSPIIKTEVAFIQ
jgi:hypothetical protein